MAKKEQLNPHQKLGFGVLGIIGITTFVFGLFQINRSIVEPMAREGGVHFKTAEEVEKEKIEKLKQQDTDGDGLHDYEELYVFRTSPFLKDSDSDGLEDGVEIAQLTDPNCPAGRSCRQARAPKPTEATGATGVDEITLAPDEKDILDAMGAVFGDLDELTPETMRMRLSEMSPAEMREFMEKIGVPEQMLQQVDDETMRSILLETMQEMPDPGEGEGEGTTDSE
jgi:hypothetical protein